MMQTNEVQCVSSLSIMPCPAFHNKVSGVVENSHQKSSEEELQLSSKLIETSIARWPFSLPKIPTFWCMFNNQVNSVLQGYKQPMCGLVALHMAGQILRNSCSTQPEISLLKIYEKAIEMNVTKQGEMFSAYEMAKLAENLYECTADVIEGNMFEMRLSLLAHLLCGHPVLVPYDNDRNFEPCERKGHKAHWAVITGAVVGSASQIQIDEAVDVEGVPNLCKLQPNFKYHQLNDLSHQLDNAGVQVVHVFAKQGKSAKIRLWSLESLSRSNGNLREWDPNRERSLYHCPRPLSEALLEKWVILRFDKTSSQKVEF